MKNYTAIERKPNLIGFGTLPANANLTWIEGVMGGGGGGGNVAAISVPVTGGAVTNFVMSPAPASADSALVFLNGQKLTRGTDYTISGNLFSMSFPTATPDILTIHVIA